MTDKHYTTPEVARACVDRLVAYGDLIEKDLVLDPCVGKGAFVSAMHDAVPNLYIASCDIDRTVLPQYCVDFLQSNLSSTFTCAPFALIVSNPPFSLSEEFVRHSVTMVDPRGAVAFLLLLQFLGSVGRGEFFQQFPPSSVDVLRPRPSFADNGQTDMREYALFRWCPQDFNAVRKTGPRVGWIDWTKPSKRKLKAAQAAE